MYTQEIYAYQAAMTNRIVGCLKSKRDDPDKPFFDKQRFARTLSGKSLEILQWQDILPNESYAKPAVIRHGSPEDMNIIICSCTPNK